MTSKAKIIIGDGQTWVWGILKLFTYKQKGDSNSMPSTGSENSFQDGMNKSASAD